MRSMVEGRRRLVRRDRNSGWAAGIRAAPSTAVPAVPLPGFAREEGASG